MGDRCDFCKAPAVGRCTYDNCEAWICEHCSMHDPVACMARCPDCADMLGVARGGGGGLGGTASPGDDPRPEVPEETVRCSACRCEMTEGQGTNWCSIGCVCLGAVYCHACWNKHIDRKQETAAAAEARGQRRALAVILHEGLEGGGVVERADVVKWKRREAAAIRAMAERAKKDPAVRRDVWPDLMDDAAEVDNDADAVERGEHTEDESND